MAKWADGIFADGWKPISTAPHSGEILLGHPDGSIMIGSRNRYGGWDDGDYRDHETWPTHWMQLPQPPKPEGGQ